MIRQSMYAWCAVAILAAAKPAVAQTVPGAPPTPEQVRAAISSELPAPPTGFSWQLYKNTVFLKPAGWHEREGKPAPGTFPIATYATSPEPFSESQPFEMGLTVQVISATQRLRGIEAKKAVLLYLKPILDSHKREDFSIFDQKPSGDYERTVLRYRDAPPGLKPVIIHKFILANNVTDSMHIFTFESPETSWNENWEKYGTPVISRLQVIAQLPIN
ncbi:hypothetical protein [Polaromonas sp. UC242_47]|uniref:hypothetical protein n=1 Tax=Polaromonas sp. UC242_47 TaxID=3374626 RepID=UPI00378BE7F7